MSTVLITGANRGIGRATAIKFLAEGWTVIGTSRKGDAAIKHDSFFNIELEVTSDVSVAAAAAHVKAKFGHIDVLINNAGVNTEDDVEFGNIAALREVLEVNLIGLVNVTQHFLPVINDGGKILNISSMMAVLTSEDGGDYPGYRISKAGVNMYTRVLSQYLQPRRITVSSVDPGWVKTDMGGSEADVEPEVPARQIYDLAARDHVSGLFWYDGQQRSW